VRWIRPYEEGNTARSRGPNAYACRQGFAVAGPPVVRLAGTFFLGACFSSLSETTGFARKVGMVAKCGDLRDRSDLLSRHKR
jgi:hypothetical protein